ncbi:MAG: WD40 repeat domain-containing protein, partial [Actinomycetia bacterium]|nr:WD40 repeat domain-containing protein [Actinomycetes bacterium]
MTSEYDLERRLAERLTELGRRDGWGQSSPYLRRHLVEHAAAGGTLAELGGDAAFLVHADPIASASALGKLPGLSLPHAAEAFIRSSAAVRSAASLGDRSAALRLEQLLNMPGIDDYEQLTSLDEPASWWPRWARAQPESFHSMLEGHTGGVVGVAWGEIDGQPRLATASDDQTVRVWDPVSGDTSMVLEGHTGGVLGVAWGEIDGQPRLATASYDQTVRVWDPVSGDTTNILEGHTNGVLGVAWGEIDGQPRLATASNDQTVRVWDPVSGDTTNILEGHTDWVRGVAWGEIDGQPRLATTSNDQTVRVWDPVSGDTTN